MYAKLVGIVSAGFGVIIFLIIMTTVTWDIQVVEPYTKYEPYSYTQSLVRTSQVQAGFLWLNNVTKAQYLVTNNETQKGNFSLNFVFDNGSTTQTVTQGVDILAGERKAVSVNSPLSGVSKVNLQVTPPSKVIQSERTVTKKVNGWSYIGNFILHVRF